MWFSKSLAEVEMSEITDLNTEKETIEGILAYIEQKKGQEKKILSDIKALKEENFFKSKALLKKDIAEIVSFLEKLKSQLGAHIDAAELNDMIELWKELEKNTDSKDLTLPDLQGEFTNLYSIMFRDLAQLSRVLSERHRKVTGFINETKNAMSDVTRQEGASEAQHEGEAPVPEKKPPVEGLDDMSKDIEISDDADEEASGDEADAIPEDEVPVPEKKPSVGEPHEGGAPVSEALPEEKTDVSVKQLKSEAPVPEKKPSAEDEQADIEISLGEPDEQDADSEEKQESAAKKKEH